jgi:DNA-binding PucR family transcriptional regulator
LTGLLLAVPREQLEAFVTRQLGPLLERPELLETLEAWFASGGSRAAVADAVGLHRNSVGYRIDRIRALLQHDPDDPSAAVDLRAALAARAVLSARS